MWEEALSYTESLFLAGETIDARPVGARAPGLDNIARLGVLGDRWASPFRPFWMGLVGAPLGVALQWLVRVHVVNDVRMILLSPSQRVPPSGLA